jgi:hypothetical protein
MARDVQGTWQAFQSNGFTVTFNVFQDEKGVLTGSASTAGLSADKCTGRVTDTDFLFTVPWTPGDSIGEYSGTFNLENRILGLTVDQNHAQNIAGWSSKQTFPA